MPRYDYKCHKCGAVFEKKQAFADALLTQHDECGGQLERLISAPALQFKGSGFYITDYARGSAPGSAPKNAEGKSEGGKSEGKSESKSEGKAESKSESKSESSPAPASTSSSDSGSKS